MSAYRNKYGDSDASRPSLFNGHRSGAHVPEPDTSPHDWTLADLLYDGFYLLFMLDNGQVPTEAEPFANSVESYLDEFERTAKKLDKSTDDIYAGKYAFCAAADEIVLTRAHEIREEWGRRPLQLQLFGDHLAGEHFFDHLERLRSEGRVRLEALEVYHLCLLLGFKGKFALEGSEKLGYITSRVGEEIANMKGHRAGFAPHWEPPDSIAHTLKRELPEWVAVCVCVLVGLITVLGLDSNLTHTTDDALAKYNEVVQLPPSSAHLTVTLP